MPIMPWNTSYSIKPFLSIAILYTVQFTDADNDLNQYLDEWRGYVSIEDGALRCAIVTANEYMPAG